MSLAGGLGSILGNNLATPSLYMDLDTVASIQGRGSPSIDGIWEVSSFVNTA